MTLSILLADDHRLFRQGLALLVQGQSDWEIVGEAGDGVEAVRLAETLTPRIAVLDVEMPYMSGIEAARRIRLVSPNTGIVPLSMYGDPIYQRRMFEAGAAAYVLKNEAICDLVDAIKAVLNGERYVSSGVAMQSPAVGRRSTEMEKNLLSDREQEVLRFLAESWRTKEIAQRLGISPKTVETYRGRIMLKLGLDNLPDLVKFAIRAGITTLDN
ncbi:MAG: response regulator transcription factor [Pseudomonadota bacterium]|nr:response regulator transcription factor [Pseudomonadota bacterium]